MLTNRNIDITEFLKLTNAGLTVADFVQVKNAIIARYKLAYGSDIDLSTASADGIFVNDLALIVNNILQTVSTIYANLDVNSATGQYLDILCRLSNVSRKPATRSTARILVKNLNNTNITVPAYFEVFDGAGTAWVGNNASDVTLAPNEELPLVVTCSEIGPVTAPAGYIAYSVDASLNVSITQSEPASVGETTESDSELRARRAQSGGAQGVTVLEALVGAIRNLQAIEDCKIYNNASNLTLSSGDDGAPLDGSAMEPHSIYVIVRKKPNVELSEQELGTLIYEKLTPGIRTNQYSGSGTGSNKFFKYIPTVIGNAVEIFYQNIYWKECTPIAPTLEISIVPGAYFNADLSGDTLGDGDEFADIANQVMTFMNSLPIGSTPSTFDIQSEVIYADPTFKGRPTYSLTNITTGDNFTNLDTYYNYTSFTVSRVGTSNTYTISFSGGQS